MRYILASLGLLVLSQSTWAKLEIQNIQAVVCDMGPVRKVLEIIPGDDMIFSYTVTGVKTDDKGRVNCSMTYEVIGPDNKTLVKETEPIQQTLALGGKSFPGYSKVSTGIDTPVMELTIKVTIVDKLGAESASFEKKFKVVQPKLAMAKLRISADKDGLSAMPLRGYVGQRVYFRFLAVHYDRSQMKLGLTMKFDFLDEKGESVLPKPIQAQITLDEPEKVEKQLAVPFSGNFTLNRPGKFLFKVTLTDDVTGESVTFESPMTSLE